MATDTLEKDEVDNNDAESADAVPGDAKRPVPRVLIGLLVVALIAVLGFFGYRYFSDGAQTSSSASSSSNAAILAVANDYAVKLSTFDYRELDQNREAIVGMSTEDFGKKYGEMVGALTEIVSNGKGEATAEVTHSAVESVDGDHATVLLFVDQKAKNVVAPEGRTQPYRMVMKLQNIDGRWLVDDVETV
ncbi:MAG: hypothetical protein WAW85_16765 [Gordonia sp. (in: high G+C Gram-positive bacteria)]|uniref:hypothetical protein n=1 Tax=Gordonia sp. (in: high G+C Gram-positive bacteria) TaxID=84139 RepID=UPI003BB536DB